MYVDRCEIETQQFQTALPQWISWHRSRWANPKLCGLCGRGKKSSLAKQIAIARKKKKDPQERKEEEKVIVLQGVRLRGKIVFFSSCLLYTSDAADE